MHRILLVDDEENVLDALSVTLRRAKEIAPVEVDTAPGGAEALARLRSHRYDLVIADYRMPGMTGVDLLRQVRDEHPATVRALLTGYSDVEIAMEAMEKAAIHYYVQKPWDNDKLRTTVAEALAGGWSRE